MNALVGEDRTIVSLINIGKSSILNALVGEDRKIVSQSVALLVMPLILNLLDQMARFDTASINNINVLFSVTIHH